MFDPERRVRRRPAVPQAHNVFYWFERELIRQGAAAGLAANYAERVFFLPEFDAETPIREGPTPWTNWEGYHAGKHGVWERFQNAKGEMVNMGDLFFRERYRWIRPEWKNPDGTLRFLTDAEFQSTLDAMFRFSEEQTVRVDAERSGLRELFDSTKFTRDIADLYRTHAANPQNTIWQGRYLVRGRPDPLQTNVDFAAHGHNWRLALDARTNQSLNFFKIDELGQGQRAKMQFEQVAVNWQGNITEVESYTAEHSTIRIGVSATWRGLLLQGMEGGALYGGIASAFLGAIDGFRQEGIPGALKGLAIGGMVGAGVGAFSGGVLALLQRIWPALGRVVSAGLGLMNWILTVAVIMLDSSETALDPQEYSQPKSDPDGNVWRLRNIERRGSFFPESIPHGVGILCTDGIEIRLGQDEEAGECSYDANPITVFAAGKRVNWAMVRTRDGSSFWFWKDLQAGSQYIVTFRNDEDMDQAIRRYDQERNFLFVGTRN